MTIKIPRRRFDDAGKPIVEMPERDPAEVRRQAVAYWRNILTATLPNGSPAYVQSARVQAEQRLQELQQEGA